MNDAYYNQGTDMLNLMGELQACKLQKTANIMKNGKFLKSRYTHRKLSDEDLGDIENFLISTSNVTTLTKMIDQVKRRVDDAQSPYSQAMWLNLHTKLIKAADEMNELLKLIKW